MTPGAERFGRREYSELGDHAGFWMERGLERRRRWGRMDTHICLDVGMLRSSNLARAAGVEGDP